MTGLELLILILASMGLINIIIYSPIAEWVRKLIVWGFTLIGLRDMGNYFMSCPPCVGVWVGTLMLVIYKLGFILFTIPLAISFIALICQVYLFPEN